jgi:thiol-disulfide isomerase/thioredoxin
MRTALAVAIVAVAMVAAGCTVGTESPPQLADLPGAELPAGKPAPDFTVTTFDGATFTLSEHLATDGRPVFLNLWASWCAPCRAEMPDLDDAATNNPGVAFIGVAVQDVRGKSQDFAEEIGVGYPLAFDEDREVDNAYAPIGLPASYIISTDGRIVERIFGPLTGAQIEDKLEAHFGGQ